MVSSVFVSERFHRKAQFSGKLNEIDNNHTIRRISVVDGPSLDVLLDSFRFATDELYSGVRFEFSLEPYSASENFCVSIKPQGIARDSHGTLWVTAVVPEIAFERLNGVEINENDINFSSAGGRSIDIQYNIETRTGVAVF